MDISKHRHIISYIWQEAPDRRMPQANLGLLECFSFYKVAKQRAAASRPLFYYDCQKNLQRQFLLLILALKLCLGLANLGWVMGSVGRISAPACITGRKEEVWKTTPEC